MTMLSLLVLLFVGHMGVATAWAQDITTGLTLWYKFDDASGHPQDSSGNARHGTLSGTAVRLSGASCKVLGCFGFSPANTTQVALNVQLGNVLMTPAAGTMALWVNPHGAPFNHPSNFAGLPQVVGDGHQFTSIGRGTLGGANDLFRFYNWDGNADLLGVTYTVDQWVHLAWVHGAGQLIAYKDGAPFGAPLSSGSTTGSNPLSLGHIGTTYLQADLDELRIYTRALTAADIAALAQYGLPTGGNRWRMLQRWKETLHHWLWAGRG